MKTRAEHLDWCKQRARELCERGDHGKALLVMARDLEKHPGTAGNHALKLSMVLRRMSGNLSTQADVLKFIDDCKSKEPVMSVRVYVVTDEQAEVEYLICAKTRESAMRYVAINELTRLTAKPARPLYAWQAQKAGKEILGEAADLVALAKVRIEEAKDYAAREARAVIQPWTI